MTITQEFPSLATSERRARVPQTWLVSPWFDALFVANVSWPALALLLGMLGPEFHEGTLFWQVYFVTAPHRWITLALVFLDRDRLRERPATFIGLAVAVVGLCLAVQIATGTLTCLLIIDYLWNAWHFASQHAGIFRIYARQTASVTVLDPGVEKLLIRGFVLYVIMRMSGLAWALLGEGFLLRLQLPIDWTPDLMEAGFQLGDWLILVLPSVLMLCHLCRRDWCNPGGMLYLTSFLSLYVAILAAVHLQRFEWVLLLATVSALFHATEYLAIVSWAVRQRFPRGPAGQNLLAQMAPLWGLAVATFAISLAAIGWIADRQLLQWWLLLNVVAAYLHYAFDGIIWKRQHPKARRME